MPKKQLPLCPELRIFHQGHSRVTEGWHRATVHDIQPYRDSWGDKMMIYFKLDGDDALKNPLVWIAPLIATPRNKTGKFLEALGLRIEDGIYTNTTELIGLCLWLKTTLVTRNHIHFYKVTQFNYEPKGGDLFDTRNYPIRENSGARETTELTVGLGADRRSDELNKSTGTDKSN